MVEGLNFDFNRVNATREEYLSELKKESQASITQPNGLKPDENLALQNGLSGSKNIKVNDYGLYEVKLKKEPTRVFYNLNDAVNFERNKIQEKYDGLKVKVQRLEQYLQQNRSLMSKKDIKKAEKAILDGQSALKTYQEQINNLKAEVLPKKKQVKTKSEFLNINVNNEPKVGMNGKVLYKGVEYPDLKTFKKFNPGVKLPEQTIASQVKQIPPVKKIDLHNSSVFPNADGKVYGDMLRNVPFQGTIKTDDLSEKETQKQKVTPSATEFEAKMQNEPKQNASIGKLSKTSIDQEKLPIKVEQNKGELPVKGEKGFFAKLKKAINGKGKTAIIAAGIVAVGTGIAMLVGKTSKQAEKTSENVKINKKQDDISTVTSEQKERVSKPVDPLIIQAQEVQNESRKQIDESEYIVKKGDNIWNIAKRNLIDKYKNEKFYNPSEIEILEETKRIMGKNNLKFEEDNYHVMILPGDRLQLAA